MYMTAHWDDKQGDAPKTVYDWSPHEWDPVISEEWQQREANAVKEILREANKKAQKK